jgi:GMP synthase (glutamine-hydrolysing)
MTKKQFHEETIVILTTGSTIPSVAARRGEFWRWIESGLRPAWGGEVVEIDLRAGAPPREVLGAAGLVITGSPSSVTERAPWMLEAEAFLREALVEAAPVLGICFGHQLLAQALGGEVTRNPRGREIGTVRVRRLGDDPLFAGLGGELVVNATHVDAVTRVPEGATVLADTALDPVAAFSIGSARCVQFHPEIDLDIMRSYLEARREVLLAEGISADELLARAEETPDGQAILANFALGLGGRRRG